MNAYTKLIRSKQTVFTTKDLALIWQEDNHDVLKNKIYRYKKSGKLFSPRRGLYVLDQDFDKFELGSKIYTPSYISFESVLRDAGVIFQFTAFTMASYLTRSIRVRDDIYQYHQIRDNILLDHFGINSKGKYSFATLERAWLDTIYLHPNYHFDNLRPLAWEKVEEILPIYGGNQRMQETVDKLKKSSEEGRDVS